MDWAKVDNTKDPFNLKNDTCVHLNEIQSWSVFF